MFNVKSFRDIENEIEEDYQFLVDDTSFKISHITDQCHYEWFWFFVFNFKFFFNEYYVSKDLKFSPRKIKIDFWKDYLHYLVHEKNHQV